MMIVRLIRQSPRITLLFAHPFSKFGDRPPPGSKSNPSLYAQKKDQGSESSSEAIVGENLFKSRRGTSEAQNDNEGVQEQFLKLKTGMPEYLEQEMEMYEQEEGEYGQQMQMYEENSQEKELDSQLYEHEKSDDWETTGLKQALVFTEIDKDDPRILEEEDNDDGLGRRVTEKRENFDEEIENSEEQYGQEWLEQQQGNIQFSNFKLHRHDQLFTRLTDEVPQLLEWLEEANWQNLTEKMIEYATMDSVSATVNIVHPILLAHDPVAYLKWLSTTKIKPQTLPSEILRNILGQLVNRQELAVATILASKLSDKNVNIDYELLDIAWAEFEPKAHLKVVKEQLGILLDFSLQILLLCKENPKLKKQSLRNRYQLGPWFRSAWALVKQRHICIGQFKSVFQALMGQSDEQFSFQDLHADGIFLDILEGQYFGSHVSGEKVFLLLKHYLKLCEFSSVMRQLRDRMLLYRIRTGLAPFPAASFMEEADQVASYIEDQQEIAIQLQEQLNQQEQINELVTPITKSSYSKKILNQDLNDNTLEKEKEQEEVSEDLQFEEKIEALHDQVNGAIEEGVQLKQQLQQDILKEQKLESNEIKVGEKLKKDNQLHQSELDSLNDKEFLLFRLLCEFNETKPAFQLFKDHPNLYRRLAVDQELAPFVQESLLNVPKEMLVSDLSNKLQLVWDQDKMFENIQKFCKYKARKLKKSKEPEIEVEGNPYKEQDQFLEEFLNPTPPKAESIQEKTFKEAIEKIIDKDQVERVDKENEEQNLGIEKIQIPVNPEVAKLQFLHRGARRLETLAEKNWVRRETLRVLICSKEVITSVKAAIKLDRLELAFTLFSQHIMRPLIHQRMALNIDYAVRAFIKDHHLVHKQYNIHEILEGLSMRQIEALDYEEEGPRRNLFLEGIYHKLQNLDHLLAEYMPPPQIKHDFWENTLAFERADLFIKMDISGRLKDFSYIPEQEQVLPKRQVSRFRSDLGWRDELIYGLGIDQVEPQAVQSDLNQWRIATSDEQASQILLPEGEVYSQYEAQEEEVQEGEIEADQEQQQEQQVETAEAEGEEAAAVQGEGEEAAVVEGEGEQAVVEGQGEIQEAEGQIQGENVEEVSLETGEFEDSIGKSIYQESLRSGLNGYDFNVFLQQSRNIFRPKFEQDYEAEKQFKRHILALDALAEEARIADSFQLQKKLNEAEEEVTDPLLIANLTAHGLWHFDFVTVQQPADYPIIADIFRHAYFRFRKYQGRKAAKAVPSRAKQHIKHFSDAIIKRQITTELVEELLLKRQHYFHEAEAVVRIEPVSEVQELIAWGLLNDEPLAIYLGQKLAMITNQIISHPIALAVAQYLSHRRQIPHQRVQRCKEALRIVGRINREHIYDINHDYEHITVRKHLRSYLQNRRKQVDSDGLQVLTQVDPTHFAERQSGAFSRTYLRSDLTV